MSARNQFRFEALQINPIGVRLSSSERAPLLGEPLLIDPEGVRARFSSHQAFGIALGDQVELEFSSRDWRAPIEVLAQLRARHEQASIRDLEFTFVDRKQVEEELLPRLRALLNRRGATRAAADPKHPVEVLLEERGSGRSVPGRLVEVSSTGLLMEAPLGGEAGFVDAKECLVSLCLPLQEAFGLSIVAHIRGRSLCSESIQLGLEFDGSLTPDFAAQRDKILEYVMLRQPRSAHRLRFE